MPASGRSAWRGCENLRNAARRAPPPTDAAHAVFCSGCPHNTSTRVPEGSRALAGIGCHAHGDVHAGAPHRTYRPIWAAKAPPGSARRRSPPRPHVFQNLGDGTYSHSGLLAIRAAAASGVNITYKILFNDAVAMTGGQPVEGASDRAADHAAGAGRRRRAIVVVTDEPDKYPADAGFAAGRRHPPSRRSSTRCSASCATSPGLTVLVYDQTCAAEKRRRRKRGTVPRPAEARLHQRGGLRRLRRLLGRNRTASRCSRSRPSSAASARIDQSNCNKDFSCLKGFCPSFVTVHGGAAAQAAEAAGGGGRRPVRRRSAGCRSSAADRATPTASSSPASAAPASSPSARCSAWRRISKARAAPCSTSPACRRRTAR